MVELSIHDVKNLKIIKTRLTKAYANGHVSYELIDGDK